MQPTDGKDSLGPNATAHVNGIQDLQDKAVDVIKERIERNPRRATKLERMSCWPDVLAMLENGVKVTKIAEYIQVERKEYLDVPLSSVEAILYYWLRKHPIHKIDRAPTRHIELINSTPERVDPLDALNMIFAIMVDRITEHYVAERQNKSYTQFNNQALKIATEMVKTMADIQTKERRYTVPPPAKGPNETYNQLEQIRLIYEQKYGGAVARTILNDESRRKILSALNRVRNGNSEALMKILNANAQKAKELEEQELERVRAESEPDPVIEVDVE